MTGCSIPSAAARRSARPPRCTGLGVGLTWRANLMCGNLDLQTTLRNQLNGVTEGFQQIMGSVVQNATQAVMSLPALIV